jgi:hypothetical protein
MTTSDVVCPHCGARLIPEHSVRDAEAGESLWIGQCENQHWWLHSPVLGCIPIDPGVMAVNGATTTTTREDAAPG